MTGQAGPALTPIHFSLTRRLADSSHTTYIDPDFCDRIEVRVVARDAATHAASFTGLGFSTSRGETFTPKSELQPVGHVNLANGDAATVYRFAGISTRISSAHSSTSGNLYQTFAFKPYAAFDAGNTRYRVWDAINGDYHLGRSWPGAQPTIDSKGFDRQAELLAH